MSNYNYNSKEGLQVSSINKLVDLFYSAGIFSNRFDKALKDAYAQNPELATKIMLWSRDARSGAGIRDNFRKFIVDIYQQSPTFIHHNLDTIVKYGYWKDLFHVMDDVVIKYWIGKLNAGDNLAKKWAPRLGGKQGELAKRFIKIAGITNKEYRKLIKVNTVESQMCNEDWSEIELNKIPGKALVKYKEALKEKHPGWNDWVVDDAQKSNSSVLFPHEILNVALKDDKDLSDKLWKDLPKFINDKEIVFPMIDLSGSMNIGIENSGDMSAMQIAIALGVFAAASNPKEVMGRILSFSERPKIYNLGSLVSESVYKSFEWICRHTEAGLNTNYEAAYKLLLAWMKSEIILPEHQPTVILVLSDMEFDASTRGWGWNSKPMLHTDVLKKMYKDAGYKFPKLVYWNLNANSTGFPVSENEEDVVLVSGFSSAILKSVLKMDINSMNPYTAMLDVVGNYQFNPIGLPKLI